MNKAKMTAGPWKFAHDHSIGHFEIETLRQDEGYMHLTNRWPMSPLNEADRAECGCSKEQLANARAIACLPELIEAAREAVRERPKTDLTSALAVIDNLRRILARIEGEDA